MQFSTMSDKQNKTKQKTFHLKVFKKHKYNQGRSVLNGSEKKKLFRGK